MHLCQPEMVLQYLRQRTNYNVHILDDAVSVVDTTGCIHLCKNHVVPNKTLHIYQNNKSWVMKSPKSTLNDKKTAYMAHGIADVKRVQVRHGREIT